MVNSYEFDGLALIPLLCPGCVLVKDEKGTQVVQLELERAYTINNTAYEVLSLVDGANNVGNIVGVLKQKYPVSLKQISTDVMHVLNSMQKLNMVTYISA